MSASARLRFPWGGEDVAVGAVLLVGRENSPLADRLQQYGNVSRRHAEIRSVGGLLLVVDLRSANGTFVNDQRVAPMEPHPVHRGDTVRFGAVLRAVVEGA